MNPMENDSAYSSGAVRNRKARNSATHSITVRNIVIYALLVNGLAWLGPLLGGDPTNPGLGLLVWGTAPLVAALLMKFVFRDPVEMGWRPKLRGNGRWYALSLLIYPIAILLVLSIGLLTGATTMRSFTVETFVSTMAPLAVIYFFFALFEEAGWRGYLTPRVAEFNDGLVGHLLVGLIWASWHLPYLSQLWAHTGEGIITLLPRFVLGTVVSAVLYGEIRLRTGTLWPAVLMHWVGNTLANTLLLGADGGGFVEFAPGRVWIGSFGVEGVLMMLIFGVLGGVLYVSRRKHHLPQPPRTVEQAA